MRKHEGIATGIRVIEVGSSLSVSLAGMTLADAGAEVIAVEKPGGSFLRSEPAFPMWTRGKSRLTLDLAASRDHESLRSLIRDADVLLLGLKPASLKRLDLSYAALSPAAPQLIYGALTGFGINGPYGDTPVYDAVMQARGGRMYEFSTLHDGERPAFAAAQVAAYGSAMALVAGVFGALRQREERGGRGQCVEATMARGLAVYDLAGWMPGGPPPLRTEDVPFLPYSVARTADGKWVQFAQNGPALFADFLRVLGLEGEIDYLAAMVPVADNSVKRAQRAKVQARMAEKTWTEWQTVFADERNLSVELFYPPGEALRHPQFEAIGDVIDLPGMSGEPTRQLGPLFDVPNLPLRPSSGEDVDTGAWSANEADRPQSLATAAERKPLGAGAKSPGLLAGVTILELGMWIALPFAATQLAELGARVIKVEPLEGDPMRTTGPVAYKIVQGKESLALDLKQPEAREIVHRLVKQADAVLHSYRPGVPERLGIDFATLSEINPRLVYLYNGSYGSRGPKSYAPAFHVTGGAVAGGAYAQAGEGCPPPPNEQLSSDEMALVSRRLELANEANPDFNSAVTAAAATIMGLYHVDRTGSGIEIETRMMLSNAMMMSSDFIDYEGRPSHTVVDSELNGLGPLYRLYRAADGWVFLAAPQQRDFERLCVALGVPAIAEDERFATAAGRSKSAEALTSALAERIAKSPANDLEQELTAAGIACVRADEGPYRTWLFDQEWALDSGDVVDTESSIGGTYRRYGAPLITEGSVTLRGAGAAGAETRAILREIGYEDDAIESLVDSGVVAIPATE